MALKNRLRRPRNLIERKQLASRDFLRRQQKAARLRNAISEIIRNLTRLTAGVQQYFKVPTRTATGDFEFEQGVYISEEAASHNMVAGYSISSSNYISFRNTSSKTVRIVIAGTTLESSSNKFTVNKFYTMSVSRVSNVVTVKLNGIVILTGTAAGDFFINRLGHYSSGLFVSGYLANVHFKSGWDDNPLYRIDETWANGSTVLHNANATIGSDITNIDALNTTAIGEPLTSTYTVVSTGQLVVGNQYVIHATVSNYQGSSTLGFLNDNGVSAAATSQDGTISKVFTATGTGTLRLFNRSSNSCSFSNIKVYEEQGAGTAVNIDKDDSQPFTRNNSVSPNVLVNNDGSISLPISGT